MQISSPPSTLRPGRPARAAVGGIIAAFVFLTAGQQASASEIRMRGGVVYSSATVLRRDDVSVEIRMASGETVTLPLAMVLEIDGVRVQRTAYPPVSAYSPPEVHPSPSATARPAPTPALTPAPIPRPTPVIAAPPATAFPSATPASVSFLSGIAWNDRRIWIGAGLALLLPALGYITYRLVRWSGQARGHGRSTGDGPAPLELLDENHQPIAIAGGEEASGLENARDVLKDALLDRASDVHIEPSASEYRVRFRIDGVMHPRMKFPLSEGVRLVSAIKSLAQADITERRKAQDGRFGARSGPREVDIRVATTPSVAGEKLVLRIFDHQSGIRGLNDLGMSPEMTAAFGKVIHSRNGMIVAAGPTGAGKTSTLYAALAQIDTVRLNIVTIEDPVEYQLAGATQIPVNPRAGVTFESGLRSILRQDPDVILVGEMRDLEAAQIALRSALTGHLVFSTLHARDAVGIIARLEEIGIERHLLATSLFVVMAQRLVRVLCRLCRQTYTSTGEELLSVGIALAAGQTIYRAVGCRRCEGSGYAGRTGVFEMLIFDEELRQAVSDGRSENDFTDLARTKGYRGYREDAAEKVLAGVTTVDEVLQAL